MSLSLRNAGGEDLPRLTQIAHAAKRHWGYPESWIRAWASELTVRPEDLAAHELYVVCAEPDQIVGFAALRPQASRCHLEHFWVDPASMGMGVGRMLFEEALRRARARGAQGLEIDSDPHAADFYRRLGAVDCGEIVAAMDGVDRIRPQLRILLVEEAHGAPDHRVEGSETP